MSNEEMFGNDLTGEVISLTNIKAGVFEFSQLRAPEGSQHEETPHMGALLFRTSSYRAAKQWWSEYKGKSAGVFVKLVKHTISATPTEVEMSTEPVPLGAPYTESSFDNIASDE